MSLPWGHTESAGADEDRDAGKSRPFRSAPLTLRPELDQLRCSEPGCECTDELVLMCGDHDAPAWATYEKGELRLECAECGELVLNVAVAG